MKLSSLLGAVALGTAVLLSGCNDDNTPRSATVITQPTPPGVTPPVTPAGPKNFSELAASLIAMIRGMMGANGCETALPADVNGSTVSDDMAEQDANAITVNCT